MFRKILLLIIPLLMHGQNPDWNQIGNKPTVSSASGVFSYTPNVSITGGVPTTITFPTCPNGVVGSASNYNVYLSGGTGMAEAVLVTGGTCVAGGKNKTLIFTPTYSHSGAWKISSATGGIQEAINMLPASTGAILSSVTGGGTVHILPGDYKIYASVYLRSGVYLEGKGPGVRLITQGNNIIPITTAVYGTTGYGVKNLSILPGNTYTGYIGMDIVAANSGTFENLMIFGYGGYGSVGIRLRGLRNVDTSCDYHNYAAQNIFRNIIITGDIGIQFTNTANCLAVTFGAGSTQNNFHDVIMNLGTGPGIDFQADTDTNFFYGTYIGWGGAAPSPAIKFGSTSSNLRVGGNMFFGLHVTNATDSAAIPLQFGQTDNNMIFGFTSVGSLYPFTILSTSLYNVVIGRSSGDQNKTIMYLGQGAHASDPGTPTGLAVMTDDGSGNIVYAMQLKNGTVVEGNGTSGNQLQGSANVVGPTFSQTVNYIGTETGANNAIVGSLSQVTFTTGLCVYQKLSHSLQIGANTYNYNGGGALNIKSSRNISNDITTGWAAGGMIPLCTNGSIWMDMTQ